MPVSRTVIIIAKERPFDAEKWKQLLTAFAYVLLERRNAHGQGTTAHSTTRNHDTHDRDTP